MDPDEGDSLGTKGEKTEPIRGPEVHQLEVLDL